jgi:hypothetical protein
LFSRDHIYFPCILLSFQVRSAYSKTFSYRSFLDGNKAEPKLDWSYQSEPALYRKYWGYECAGATLGHTNMSATAIYAERNQGLADEAAKRFG